MRVQYSLENRSTFVSSMPFSSFLAASFIFLVRSSSTTALAFLRMAFLLSWAWIAFSNFPINFTLERGRYREHIAVKVDGTSLVFVLGEHFTHSFQHTSHLSPTTNLASAKPRQEADPACLILFYTVGSPQNLTVAVLVYCNSYQNSHIFKLSGDRTSPFLAYGAGSPVYIDIQISSLCRGQFRQSSMWTYTFLFNSLMVEGDTLLPHRASVMSSTRRTDTPARYILMRASSTHTTFPAAIPLNDGRSQRRFL